MTPALEEWIDRNGLREVEKQWRVHFQVYGVGKEDIDSLIRLCFISLRTMGAKKLSDVGV